MIAYKDSLTNVTAILAENLHQVFKRGLKDKLMKQLELEVDEIVEETVKQFTKSYIDAHFDPTRGDYVVNVLIKKDFR